MPTCDVLLVGQGLAGSVLAMTLLDAGKDIRVINTTNPNASSYVAAGLMNPVTGRRFVLSWKYAELITLALEKYQRWSEILGRRLIEDMPIIRAVNDARYEDDVAAKPYDPVYANYISAYEGDIPEPFQLEGPRYLIHQSYRLDVPTLLDEVRRHLQSERRYIESDFDYQALHEMSGHWVYNDIQAEMVVFCEGFMGKYNPYFSYLSFQPSKGEVLHIASDEMTEKVAMKKTLMNVPMEGFYWVGSHNQWKVEDERPTQEGRNILLEKLATVYNGVPKVLDHKAAVRPTTKDRRPLVGEHPEHKGIFILNGLGTKGSSIAPYAAAQLMEALLHGAPLDPQIDIARCAYRPE